MNTIAKTFSQIMKFNPWHDRLGMFTSGNSGGAIFSANPESKAGAAAISRLKDTHPLIAATYGQMKTPGQIKSEKMKVGSRSVSKVILEENGLPASRDNVAKLASVYEKFDTENIVRYDQQNGKIVAKKRALEAAKEAARDIAKDVEVKGEGYDEYKDLRERVRSTSVSISNYDKHDIPDYGNYTKENFGSVKISNKSSTSVDTFYEELSDEYPHLFSKSVTSPSEKLQTINSTLKKLKEKSVRKLTNEEVEDYAEGIARQMINYYAYR